MDINIPVNQFMEQLSDGIYIVNQEREIVFWNKAAERITGFSSEEVLHSHCYDNILNHVDKHGKELCHTMCPLAHTMSDKKHREAEVYLHHKKGHRVPVWVRVTPLYNEQEECIGGIELFTDISNRWNNEERIKELEKLAMLDTLTEVANRYYLTQHLESSFEERKRYEIPFGVLFFDIDNFKHFNDTYGHDLGDKVLQLVSRTVTRNLRPFDLFGRWGGEEFLAIIRNVNNSELLQVAERFRSLIENSFLTHQEEQLSITVSIGATMVQKGDTPGSLVARADELLYTSKENGKNQVTSDHMKEE